MSVRVVSHREGDRFVDTFAPSQQTLEMEKGTAPLSILPAKQLEGLRGSATPYEAGALGD